MDGKRAVTVMTTLTRVLVAVPRWSEVIASMHRRGCVEDGGMGERGGRVPIHGLLGPTVIYIWLLHRTMVIKMGTHSPCQGEVLISYLNPSPPLLPCCTANLRRHNDGVFCMGLFTNPLACVDITSVRASVFGSNPCRPCKRSSETTSPPFRASVFRRFFSLVTLALDTENRLMFCSHVLLLIQHSSQKVGSTQRYKK